MEDKLAEFLSNGSDDGCGDGSGRGSEDGFGYGRGCSSGIGSGYSDGYSRGDGGGYGYSGVFVDGPGEGSGFGSGDGCGAGSDNGHGSGYGDGRGIVRFEKKPVVFVDDIKTVVSSIKENVMSGYILNSDFTKEKCYVVKGNGFFAHGKTIKEAQKALVEKYMESMDEDDIFEKFMSEFNHGEKYKGAKFFDWHHYLTGSCLMGRESFVKNHGLDLEKEYAVEEFFDLCRNDYGGEVIQRLEKLWGADRERRH